MTKPEREAIVKFADATVDAPEDPPVPFTWDDVDALREVAADLPNHQGWGDDYGLRDLADRIAALLPPREEKP